MIDPERFRHDRSAYERPNFPYRCGRAATWGKPCAHGPEADGSCGGVAECRPVKRGDRFECRRPGSAGGPCDTGPDSSGACSQQLPPCTPRPTLRRMRGRLGLLAAGLVVALIAALVASTPSGQAKLSSLNPGSLTGTHAGFSAKDGCVTCHDAHGAGAAGWLKAVFVGSDMTEKCLTCHSFDGPVQAAHNTTFADRADVTAPTCSGCHQEHRGVDADIAHLSNEQCSSCHKEKFTEFAGQHPAFSKTYPYFARTGIKFDHVSHMSRHFGESRVADRAPKTCVTCHDVDVTQRLPQIKPFEDVCAGCHAQQVAQKEMVLLRLPEFEKRTIDRAALGEACGPTPADMEAMEEKVKAAAAGRKPKDGNANSAGFESVSSEELNPVGAFLIGATADDQDSYAKPMEELLQAMVEDAGAALVERIKDIGGNAAEMLAGLNPEVARRVACAWSRNEEYELPAEAEMGGWYGDGLELRYRPHPHVDPVSRAWINFAVAQVANAKDDDARERAKAMRDELLSTRDGVGNCMKCHGVVQAAGAGADNLAVVWNYREPTRRPHVWFSHPAHLRLPGLVTADLTKTEQGCQTCHRLDKDADYAAGFASTDRSQFISNFSGITSNTCAQCHNAKAVREDCQLCHRYHRAPALRVEVTSEARKP